MKRFHRFSLLALIAILLLAIASPVVATEDTTDGDVTETTAVPEQISEGEGPAVEAPPAEAEEVEQPWTARFIYPVIVIATVVLIVGLAVGYNRSIRRKYHVVS